MDKTVEEVFENDLLHDRKQLISEYYFQLGIIKTRITIKLYKHIGENTVEYEQSHFISTPLQGGPYHPSRPEAEDEVRALQRVIDDLTNWYRDAENNGHDPNESWLEKNEDF